MERLEVVQSHLIEIANEIEEIKSCDLIKCITQIVEPMEKELKAILNRKHNLQTILNQLLSSTKQSSVVKDRLRLNIGGKNYDLKRSDISKEVAGFLSVLFDEKWNNYLLKDKYGRNYFDYEYEWFEPLLKYCVTGSDGKSTFEKHLMLRYAEQKEVSLLLKLLKIEPMLEYPLFDSFRALKSPFEENLLNKDFTKQLIEAIKKSISIPMEELRFLFYFDSNDCDPDEVKQVFEGLHTTSGQIIHSNKHFGYLILIQSFTDDIFYAFTDQCLTSSDRPVTILQSPKTYATCLTNSEYCYDYRQALKDNPNDSLFYTKKYGMFPMVFFMNSYEFLFSYCYSNPLTLCLSFGGYKVRVNHIS
jgi:hypothetical protein